MVPSTGDVPSGAHQPIRQATRRHARTLAILGTAALALTSCGSADENSQSATDSVHESASGSANPSEAPSSTFPEAASESDTDSDPAPYGYLTHAADTDYDVSALIERLPGWNYASVLPHENIILVDSAEGVAVQGYIIYEDHFYRPVASDSWGDIPIDPTWDVPVVWIDAHTYEVLRHDFTYEEIVRHREPLPSESSS